MDEEPATSPPGATLKRADHRELVSLTHRLERAERAKRDEVERDHGLSIRSCSSFVAPRSSSHSSKLIYARLSPSAWREARQAIHAFFSTSTSIDAGAMVVVGLSLDAMATPVP